MLDAMAPARRRFVLVLAAVCAAALVAATAAFGWRSLGGADAVDQDELGPVLVVTGYGGGTDALEPLVGALRAGNRRVLVAPEVEGNVGDLDRQAEALARYAADALEDTGATSVDVVGYSAGGVVARLWVRDHGGDAVARRVLTVGSPHHGTDLAALASQIGCPRACLQLVPGSPLLRGLNAGDETPPGPRFVSVWSTADTTVTPPDTARLDGALNLTVQSLCPRRETSHVGLPGDPVVVALLRSTLGAGRPALPDRVAC